MLIRRDAFQPWDERLPVTGGDVELCLRIGGVVNVPHVKLIHHESLSRGASVPRDNVERERALYRPHLPDPFYNPNLTLRFTTCAPELEHARAPSSASHATESS